MKRQILLHLFLLSCSGLFAQTYINVNFNQAPQLQADAGTDQLICPWDMASLGGNPAAIGGNPAYAYAWTGDSLSSTTMANPTASPDISGDYVLLITDSLGCTAWDTVTVTVDTCVGVKDPQIPVEFSIYPNPNAGEFRAIAAGEFPTDQVTLKVTNLNGQVVSERTASATSGKVEEVFSLPMLSGGTYLVELRVGRYSFVRKMIIQN